MMKTYSAKPSEVERQWFLIDATNLVPGRLAALVVRLLRGKHKPMFTPHIDCGDYVVIVNASRVHFTGRKKTNKVYYRHTGYPGGIRATSPRRILHSAHPGKVIQLAVKRMMPSGPLARRQLTHLKIYAGTQHPHDAQKPQVLDVAALNPKNARR